MFFCQWVAMGRVRMCCLPFVVVCHFAVSVLPDVICRCNSLARVLLRRLEKRIASECCRNCLARVLLRCSEKRFASECCRNCFARVLLHCLEKRFASEECCGLPMGGAVGAS